jgi:DNA polymerase V
MISGKISLSSNIQEIDSGDSPMFDEGSCSEAEPFALQVHGDSMEPEFKHGCVIVVDPGAVVRHESFVVAKNADGLIFRQLIIDEDRYILRPLNPVYDEEEIDGLHMVTGLVVQQPGRRRKDMRHYT